MVTWESGTTANISVNIDAPPVRVWQAISDVERWPEWTASVTSVRLLDAGPLAVGSRAWVKQPKFPPALWRVTALTPGESFTWVSGALGFTATGIHTVVARADGAEVTLTLRFGGPLGGLWARVTRGITERYMGLEAAGLKHRAGGV